MSDTCDRKWEEIMGYVIFGMAITAVLLGMIFCPPILVASLWHNYPDKRTAVTLIWITVIGLQVFLALIILERS